MTARRLDPALLVVLGGISAALHVGKLPPALPVLGEALGVTLLQAGFLLSLVQLAGMTLGLPVGLAADSLGLKRTMVGGLAILSLASLLGGWARGPETLMLLRGVEGLCFLLAAMPAPSLIRRLSIRPHEPTSGCGRVHPFAPRPLCAACQGAAGGGCGPRYLMAWLKGPRGHSCGRRRC